MEGLKQYFLKEAKPFTTKREVNWSKVKIVSGCVLVLAILVIMCIPTTKQEETIFHEKAEAGTLNQIKTTENDPTQETIKQLKDSQVNLQQVHGSLDYLYQPSSVRGSSGGTNSGRDRTSAMILSRGGTDSRTQLSSGTKVIIRLNGKTTIAGQAMPVVGIVTSDVPSESGIAIPSGSKVLGEASFDSDNERASVLWRSIILPGGRERPFSAVSMGGDGQIGVDGNVHSDGLKNATGQTLTRFVGAYAAGSMSTGMFGANQGGKSNGIKNAIAQTATDRANAMGESLQKERKWIELQSGAETIAVLNQPFTFRDVGTMNGH